MLQQEGETIPEEVQEAGRLTHYAVETRYPGLAEPVTEDEKAVTLAEQTVRWVEQRINSSGEPPESTAADDDEGE